MEVSSAIASIFYPESKIQEENWGQIPNQAQRVLLQDCESEIIHSSQFWHV